MHFTLPIPLPAPSATFLFLSLAIFQPTRANPPQPQYSSLPSLQAPAPPAPPTPSRADSLPIIPLFHSQSDPNLPSHSSNFRFSSEVPGSLLCGITCPGYWNEATCTKNCKCAAEGRMSCSLGVEVCYGFCWCKPLMVPVTEPWGGEGPDGDVPTVQDPRATYEPKTRAQTSASRSKKAEKKRKGGAGNGAQKKSKTG